MPTVLVVDDDPDIRAVVALKLDLAGHSARVARDGVEALRAIGDERPDLVLLDWMMPRLTGLEVCRALRDAQDPVPVIFLTSKSREEDIERAFAAGADDYVVKPFSPRELMRRVDAVLARAR